MRCHDEWERVTALRWEWQYRFDIDPDPLTGKRRRLTKSGFTTKREASAAMREAISAHERGRSVRRTRRTLSDFLAEWLPAVQAGIRASTWVNYRDYIRAYVDPIIGATRLQDLTPQRLNLLYGHLLREGRVKAPGGLSPKTVQNVHRMLHRALTDAVKWGLIPRNVAEDAQPPRVGRKRPRIWAPDQLRQFVLSVRTDRFFALWMLVATTGLRRGELAGLLASDVDLEYGRVSPTVPRVVVAGRAEESEPKSNAGIRTLALDPDTRSALETFIQSWSEERRLLGQASELLFVHADGRPLHPDTITSRFHRHCEAAGLPRIRLHDVRHSYATAALKAGVSPKIISERLGHATVAFTLQTYAHVIPAMDEHAANTVAALIMGDGQDGTKSGTILAVTDPQMELAWAKAQASGGSGGRI